MNNFWLNFYAVCFQRLTKFFRIHWNPPKIWSKTTPQIVELSFCFLSTVHDNPQVFFPDKISRRKLRSANSKSHLIHSSYHLHSLPTVFSVFPLLLFIAPCLQRSCYTFWSLRNSWARLLLLLAPAVLISEDFSFALLPSFGIQRQLKPPRQRVQRGHGCVGATTTAMMCFCFGFCLCSAAVACLFHYFFSRWPMTVFIALSLSLNNCFADFHTRNIFSALLLYLYRALCSTPFRLEIRNACSTQLHVSHSHDLTASSKVRLRRERRDGRKK